MYFHIVSSLEKAIGMPLNETSTGKSKEVNLCQKLFFLQNMLCTKIVRTSNNFCTQHALPRFELGIFMY